MLSDSVLEGFRNLMGKMKIYFQKKKEKKKADLKLDS